MIENNIDQLNLHQIGPAIENHKFFPNKTNVEFVEVIDLKKIKMKVWERGAGITLACGSGACAAVYAGWKKKLIDNQAEVLLEKGLLNINILNISIFRIKSSYQYTCSPEWILTLTKIVESELQTLFS